MKKRVFSALLCLVMVIGLLPGIALADQKAAPPAPAETQIPTQYMVYCEKHGAKPVDLIWDTFEIGDVTEEGTIYVCPITIATEKYAEKYSETYGKHVAMAESVTFNMTWNGKEWKAPEMTEMPMIKLACVPEAPDPSLIPLEYLVGCACNIDETASMDLIEGTAKMGEVAMVDGKFVCPFTIETAPYVEEYSKEHGKHVAEFETVTFNMTWDDTKWVVPEKEELFIAAFCAPAMTAIPTDYIVSCEKHGAKQMDLIWDTFTIGEVTKKDGEIVCPITIKTAPYAEEYSKEHGEHAAVAKEISFNMKWDGLKWIKPEMTELPAINVECVVPEAPAATAIPTDYIVSCGKHGGEMTKLLPDTFTIGEVTEKDGQYICPITITTEAYAEAYSTREHGKHEAIEKTITFNMTWNGKAWEAPATTRLPEIKLECVVPAAPAANELPARYFVSCEKHGSAWMFEIPGTVEIGEVTQQPSGDYVCTITVSTADYAEEYSKACGEHKATVDSVSYTMAWNGRKWVAPAYAELPVIALECVVTEPEAPKAPAAPAANELPARYFVSCEKHGSAWMFEIPGTVKIGEVTQQPSGDYVCTITVSTADYAEFYPEACGEHKATVDSVSYTMAWNGRKWVAPAYAELPVIALECVVTEPEAPKAPEAPAANELPMGYMVKCNQGRLFHGARFIYQQPEGFTIGEVEKVGDTYVCTVTVDTEQYAKAYSNCWGIHKTHTAVDKTISFTMTWNGEKWVAPAYTELPVINVACARTNSWFPVNFPWLKW